MFAFLGVYDTSVKRLKKYIMRPLRSSEPSTSSKRNVDIWCNKAVSVTSHDNQVQRRNMVTVVGTEAIVKKKNHAIRVIN